MPVNRKSSNVSESNKFSSMMDDMLLKLKNNNPAVQAAVHPDYAKNRYDTPSGMEKPQDHHSQVLEARDYYKTTIANTYCKKQADAANTGFKWESKAGNKGVLDFFNLWSDEAVNANIPNCGAGLDKPVKWILKHLVVEGMATMIIQWGFIPIRNKMWKAPIALTVLGSDRIVLYRPNNVFDVESVVYLNDSSQEAINESIRLTATPTPQRLAELVQDRRFTLLNPADTYVFKWDWTPGFGLYPDVPLEPIFDPLKLYKMLYQMDISLADSVVYFLMIVTYGDIDHHPTEENLAKIKQNLMVSGKMGQGNFVALPYYSKIELLEQNIESLMSKEKFVSLMQHIMAHFGFMVDPGGRSTFGKVSMGGLKGHATSLQRSLIDGFNWVSMRIMQENPEMTNRKNNSIEAIPKFKPNQATIVDDDTLKFYGELFGKGGMSVETIHNSIGIDHEIEMERIADQAESKTEVMAAAAPVLLKQSVDNGETEDEDGNKNKNEKKDPANELKEGDKSKDE